MYGAAVKVKWFASYYSTCGVGASMQRTYKDSAASGKAYLCISIRSATPYDAMRRRLTSRCFDESPTGLHAGPARHLVQCRDVSLILLPFHSNEDVLQVMKVEMVGEFAYNSIITCLPQIAAMAFPNIVLDGSSETYHNRKSSTEDNGFGLNHAP